jgi:hypothetical protein
MHVVDFILYAIFINVREIIKIRGFRDGFMAGVILFFG